MAANEGAAFVTRAVVANAAVRNARRDGGGAVAAAAALLALAAAWCCWTAALCLGGDNCVHWDCVESADAQANVRNREVIRRVHMVL